LPTRFEVLIIGVVLANGSPNNARQMRRANPAGRVILPTCGVKMMSHRMFSTELRLENIFPSNAFEV
jgi:hypothetical protein